MFVLEINFHDGVSPPEVVLVRRPQAIVGTSDFAHVVIDGAASSFYELRVGRGLGREFRCQPISRVDQNQPLPAFLDGVYYGEVELDLGEVTTHITTVDLDLQILPTESPDRAGLRILRRALTSPSPLFPAVAVLGSIPLFTSFPADQALLVGRSRKCGLRLDSSEISAEHARIGFSDGQFWVEDLGSTNGTFVKGERVAGRRQLEADETIVLGTEFVLAGVRNQQDVALLNQRSVSQSRPMLTKQRYPCLIAQSDVVRPGRFVLVEGVRVGFGRDPANDIWIGAAHVSRNHGEVMLNHARKLEILDSSSNGITVNGRPIPRGVPVSFERGLVTLDLGMGIRLAVCYAEEDETTAQSNRELEQIHAPTSGDDLLVSGDPSVAVKLPAAEGGTSGFQLVQGDSPSRERERFPWAEPSLAQSELRELSSRETTGGVFERLAQRQRGGAHASEPHVSQTLVMNAQPEEPLPPSGEPSQRSMGRFSQVVVVICLGLLLMIIGWAIYMLLDSSKLLLL